MDFAVRKVSNIAIRSLELGNRLAQFNCFASPEAL